MKIYKVLIVCPEEEDREIAVKARSREDACKRAIDNAHCQQQFCWYENNPELAHSNHLGIVWRVNGVFFRTFAWLAPHMNGN